LAIGRWPLAGFIFSYKPQANDSRKRRSRFYGGRNRI
jgi:hypothetical protein